MSPVRAQGAADSACACAGDASKLGVLGGAWAAVQVGSVQAMRGRGPGEEAGAGSCVGLGRSRGGSEDLPHLQLLEPAESLQSAGRAPGLDFKGCKVKE